MNDSNVIDAADRFHRPADPPFYLDADSFIEHIGSHPPLTLRSGWRGLLGEYEFADWVAQIVQAAEEVEPAAGGMVALHYDDVSCAELSIIYDIEFLECLNLQPPKADTAVTVGDSYVSIRFEQVGTLERSA